MSKKYLIDEDELGEYAIRANEYQEVEVLNCEEIKKMLIETTKLSNNAIIQISKYINANNLLIVRIIE